MKSFIQHISEKQFTNDEMLKMFNYKIEPAKSAHGNRIIVSDEKNKVIHIAKNEKDLNKWLKKLL